MGKKLALLAFTMTLPAAVAVADSGKFFSGVVDFYAIPKSVTDLHRPSSGNTDEDGDGFGVKSFFKVGEIAAFNLEYQKSRYDSTKLDTEQLRLGVGAMAPSGIGGFLEYVQLDTDGDFDGNGVVAPEKVDGYGVHGRYVWKALDDTQVYGDIGYLMLKDEMESPTSSPAEDWKGLEYTVGGAYSIDQNWGFFADYRITSLEGDTSKVERKFSDIRLGARFEFGV